MKKPDQKSNSKKEISRRSFIEKSAITAAAFTIVPGHVLSKPGRQAPSDTMNIACVGVGGKGSSDIRSVRSENIIALCDADDTQMAAFARPNRRGEQDPEIVTLFEKANKYRDFRKMLETEKGIDAVVVSIPDHSHAVVAMMAIKMGKHVYCQKPLTHSVYEARMLTKAAKEYNVTTQMGNQGHAGEGARLINEWIWEGAIGDVREVHMFTNRPIWPQAIGRPEEPMPVPDTLDWDQWLGPAPFRPYHRAYCPFNWRGWLDFGTGVIGDMGAHIFDHPFWALKLKAPDTVQASSSKLTDGRAQRIASEETFPLASAIHWTFPAREGMPPVKLSWFDGGLMPPRPEDLEPGRRMGSGDGGGIFIGDKGKLMYSCYGNNPRLIPETKMQEYGQPTKTMPRSPGIYQEWIEACKAGTKSTSDFSYSGLLTETMLLGNVATRLQNTNTILEWDSDNMQFTNFPEANEYLQREYREGWTL
ncbi:Gfo/Idh/MocA family protein [candidate division KSB1 bacterium]